MDRNPSPHPPSTKTHPAARVAVLEAIGEQVTEESPARLPEPQPLRLTKEAERYSLDSYDVIDG
jgi:hypothetical protein